MTVDPQPTVPDQLADDDIIADGQCATPPAEAAEDPGTPRDPALPDD